MLQLAPEKQKQNSHLSRYLAQMEQLIFVAKCIMSFMLSILVHNTCWCIMQW